MDYQSALKASFLKFFEKGKYDAWPSLGLAINVPTTYIEHAHKKRGIPNIVGPRIFSVPLLEKLDPQ